MNFGGFSLYPTGVSSVKMAALVSTRLICLLLSVQVEIWNVIIQLKGQKRERSVHQQLCAFSVVLLKKLI